VAADNVVLVGSKPVMTYVLAVVTQFHSGANEVTLKARGKAISRAVDTAEIVRHRFLQGAQVADIRIATENVTNEDGQPARVSSIAIALRHNGVGPKAPEPSP
jgi:DNA-binding protein